MNVDAASAISLIKQRSTIDELAETFSRLMAPLGMSATASGMLTGPRGLSANPIHFRNWDQGWLALYEARGFLSIDPLIRYPMISGEPGTWSEIYGRFPTRDPGHVIRTEAAKFHYREGFVTPVRTRDGSLGLVSVGGDRRTSFSAEERLFVEATSLAVLRRAEEILDAAVPVELPIPLSMRERECVGLLRMGLTDAEIAKVLRVSPTTVRGFVDSARQKLGAKNRTQLAVMVIP